MDPITSTDPLVTAAEHILPPQYAAYISFGMIAFMTLGRIFHAIAQGGGLIGIWNALLYGTNTPKN